MEIDDRMGDGLAFPKAPNLHPPRMTLAQAVALDGAALGVDRQRNGLGNEREGHRGM